MASFPELKAALEDELPSVFETPRLKSVTPPRFGEVVTLDDTSYVNLGDPGDPWPNPDPVEDAVEDIEGGGFQDQKVVGKERGGCCWMVRLLPHTHRRGLGDLPS